MREIDETNATYYLLEAGLIDQPCPVRALSGGVSNVVLYVEAPGRPFVLKQSRPQLRTKDPWFSNPDRVFREVDAMKALRPALGDIVPEVLFEDRANYLFTMSAAPSESVVWKHRLLAGDADADIARKAARILATIHQQGSNNPDWKERFFDQENFYQLRLEPYYVRLPGRFPELSKQIHQLISETQSTRLTLTHADFSPKNMLVHQGSITLVDYETVHFGDPAFDLGFFLAHLHLKAIFHRQHPGPFLNLVETFWESYLAEIQFAEPAALAERGLRNLAACMLVRIDGTSPVDYLTEEELRDRGRRFARTLFQATHPLSWRESLEQLHTVATAH